MLISLNPAMQQTSSHRLTLSIPTPSSTYFDPNYDMRPTRRISTNSRTSSSQALLTFGALPSPANTDTPIDAEEYFSTWRGRKLRVPGPLPWPCDSLETERVEAQHWLLKLLLGVPYIGPVGQIVREAGRKARVLDVATGVGVWAMDLAEIFPWVEVVGCDNAPIQES